MYVLMYVLIYIDNTQQKVIYLLSKLKEASNKIGLCINEVKTKCVILSWMDVDHSFNLKVGNFSFEI